MEPQGQHSQNLVDFASGAAAVTRVVQEHSLHSDSASPELEQHTGAAILPVAAEQLSEPRHQLSGSSAGLAVPTGQDLVDFHHKL